jgi:hypothetical protein
MERRKWLPVCSVVAVSHGMLRLPTLIPQSPYTCVLAKSDHKLLSDGVPTVIPLRLGAVRVGRDCCELGGLVP